ncbi:MAG: NnrU family protein [Rhodospirillaceae bacterium]
MIDSLALLGLATLAFAGGHFLLSSAGVRGRLAGFAGEAVFRAGYSLFAAVTLVWMILEYRDAPHLPLWDAGIFGPPVILIFMLLASILLVCSVTTKNPTLVGMDGLHSTLEPGRGIYAVTRHPMLAAIALWAISHVLVRGDAAAAIFFGGFFVLATIGMVHIDMRRRARADDAWRSFEAGTSRMPFRAIVEGRRTLRPAEIGWWRIGLGVAVYFAALYVHEGVGMDLFPVH